MDVNFQPAGVTTVGTFTPDNLIVGGFPIHAKPLTIKSGAVLKRGTVLEVSSTAGKYQAVTTDADATYILAEDCDATSADKVAPVYVTGTFNKSALILGDGATLAGVVAALEGRSIFAVATVA